MLRKNGASRVRQVAASELGLGQKGTWSGSGAPNSPDAEGVPPAKRRDLERFTMALHTHTDHETSPEYR